MTRRLPVFQQSEIYECGLTCIAMIARYHGHDADLAGLRRRFPVSQKGMNLARLIAVANNLELDTRPLRVEVEDLADLQLPCILHWDLNHFVVLKQVRRGKAVLHDPARGAITMSLSEFGRHFTGVVLELSPAADFKPQELRQRITLRSLVGQVSGVARAAIQISLLALVLEMFTLALPLALQWVVDLVLVSGDVGLLTVIGIAFLCIVLFQAVFAIMRGWIVSALGASLSAQWMTNLFGHLMRLPLDYYEKRSVGGVLSRFISVQAMQRTVTGSFIEAILDGLMAMFVIGLLALYSGIITLVVLGAFLLYTLLRLVTYQRLQQLKEEQLVHIGNQQSHMIESIEGIQTIKLANKQGDRIARMSNVAREIAQRETSIERTTTTFSALSKLIFGVQRIMLIWIGAWLTLSGKFTAGMLVVVVAYSEMFAQRAAGLIDKLVEFRLLSMHGSRIADIALSPPEQNLNTEQALSEVSTRIEVDDVSFRYDANDPWVLRNCTFSVSAGESVAIVGPSGCGKTTLAKLILGLLLPENGSIRIGGADIRKVGLAAYRDLYGVVMQDDALFAGSIADNISFFDPEAPIEQVREAARAAQIDEDISRMPMGYESLVGDMGSTLSGGQKQRVLLARALYRKPAILLLDEATSHLDSKREREVNSTISALKMTKIVIAHRLETIRSVDRVIELQHEGITQMSGKDYVSANISALKAPTSTA